MASPSCCLAKTTLEVELPEREFYALRQSLLQYKRRSNSSTMARESMNYYRTPPLRSSYSAHQPAPSGIYNANGSMYNGAVQPPALSRAYTTSAISELADDTSSNVTGYRRCLDVPGLPQKNYWSSGANQRDRNPQYFSRASGRRPASDGDSMTRTKELVRYQTAREELTLSDIDDNATVLPADSISNVSSNRSRPSWSSRDSRRSSQSNRSSRRDSVVSVSSSRGYSKSDADNLSTFEGQQEYNAIGGYYMVERRPRGNRG